VGSALGHASVHGALEPGMAKGSSEFKARSSSQPSTGSWEAATVTRPCIMPMNPGVSV
jgi:hypothetical protein